MAVVLDWVDFRRQQLSVGSAFEWPLGMWEAQGVAVGDVSGGNVAGTLDLPNDHMYSLEGAAANKEDATGSSLRVTWQPRIQQGGTGWHARLELTVTGSLAVVQMRDMLMLRWPIGSPYPGEFSVSVRLDFSTNTNGVVYRSFAWGHYWDKRGLLTETGPRRT